MQKYWSFRSGPQWMRAVVAAGVIAGGSIVASGCDSGSSNQGDMVKPEVPPEVAGKASMDAYLKANPKSAPKAAAPAKP
jgi:hypothetical protein